jgi:hypothetical protein
MIKLNAGCLSVIRELSMQVSHLQARDYWEEREGALGASKREV